MVGFLGLDLANHVKMQLGQLSGLCPSFLLSVFGDVGNPKIRQQGNIRSRVELRHRQQLGRFST